MSHSRAQTAPTHSDTQHNPSSGSLHLHKSLSYPSTPFTSLPTPPDTSLDHHDPWTAIPPMNDSLNSLDASWRGKDSDMEIKHGKEWDGSGMIPTLGESSKTPINAPQRVPIPNSDPAPPHLPAIYQGPLSVDVLASLMESSRGRDKVLVCALPPSLPDIPFVPRIHFLSRDRKDDVAAEEV
jgi:hypothetical protein